MINIEELEMLANKKESRSGYKSLEWTIKRFLLIQNL